LRRGSLLSPAERVPSRAEGGRTGSVPATAPPRLAFGTAEVIGGSRSSVTGAARGRLQTIYAIVKLPVAFPFWGRSCQFHLTVGFYSTSPPLSTSFLRRLDLFLEDRVGPGDGWILLHLSSGCQPLFSEWSGLSSEDRVGPGACGMLLQLASGCQPLFYRGPISCKESALDLGTGGCYSSWPPVVNLFLQRSASWWEDRVGPGSSGMLLHRATFVNPSFQKGPASFEETAWDPGGTAIR